MAANAQDSGGADSLTKALASHKGKFGHQTSVKDIDTDDSEKIVSHVFGSKKDDVVKAVAGNKGTSTTESSAAPDASGGIGDLLGGKS